ncbi:MAG: Eco57I restriction-modification methylase domain-containing protein [Candidatus Hermodarchaeota archaeon]
MDITTPDISGQILETNINVKGLGAVYTPDLITLKMCKAVLTQIISNEIEQTTLSNNINTFRDLLSITDPELQKIILNKLKTLKILDPACGTGHFLLAMLFHLEQIYLAFQTSNPYLVKQSKAQIREYIISNNLFGVDILPEAVKIARVRLFTALAEAYEDQSIQPSSNIDFNLKTGNSVVGSYDQVDKNQLNSLDKPLDALLSERLLKILNIQNKSLTWFNKEIRPFHWTLEFPKVFAKPNDGFDIIIGNPPYVRADSSDREFQQYRKFTEKLFDTLVEKWDLYIAFIELGLKLLKPQGILAYIISDAFCTSKYAKKSRNLLLKSGFLYQIDLFPDISLFENVGVNNVIIYFLNNKNEQSLPTKRVIHRTIDKIEKIEFLNPANVGELVFRKDVNLDLLKLNTIKLKLGEICFINVGMVLNSHEKKARGEFRKENLISSKKDNVHCREYITGAYINYYQIKEIKYLEWGTNRVPHKIRRPTFPELYIPPKLMVSRIGCKAVYDERGILADDNVNIIMPRYYLRDVKNRVLNRKEEQNLTKNFADKSTHFDLRFICAIINSELGRNYLNAIRQHRMKNYIYPNELKKLPVPEVTREEQQKIVELVLEIESLVNVENFSNNKRKIKDLMQEVNSEVASLYNFIF